ncbi:nonribosomal peptide synthetase MxaA [Methylomarinum sp. Ch1-1]|uniref:Nonribosomal peptide synthetase MxaA n=1 Tax=Methylomarinum roseum TaxID=3067653 RepID=A0AAU7NYY0_9GAMM|nr:nonribosomal peptide synthetase MxaA [Methylomarinum sp. Ch1-1]MDP4521721.1 nonribosomal peptide synthetase MxaA [Methylomarinum sp. Ch1-1]
MLMITACSGRIDEAVSHFSVQTPRPFGYVIGDEIGQRIEVEVRRGFSLQYSSLPAKGRVNRWLTLKNIKVKQMAGNHGLRYRIDLRYQIFYAPLEVKMLNLPGFQLQLRQGVNLVERTVPSWYFTVAPLRELAIRKQGNKQYMRPDASAPFIDTGPWRLGLLICLFTAALAGLSLSFVHGVFSGFPRRRIFKQAMTRLTRLGDDFPQDQFKVMHDALNQLNEATLFKHQLENFYRRHSSFKALHTELQWFFDASNRLHFSDQRHVDDQTVKRIRRLCRQCLNIERGVR